MNQPSLLEFPCDFPVKIMGVAGSEFSATMIGIVVRHAPDFDPDTVELRPSRAGNYVSITCMVNAVSQAQLDALYRELTAHPLVKVAL